MMIMMKWEERSVLAGDKNFQFAQFGLHLIDAAGKFNSCPETL